MNIIATWNISLDCDCPHCKETVDLTDYREFWTGAKFDACENGTKHTVGVDVVCPECGGEFKADFVF
jgi:rubredoxin